MRKVTLEFNGMGRNVPLAVHGQPPAGVWCAEQQAEGAQRRQ